MSREREGRYIIKRIIVRGILVLDTPTCLGSGDAEGITDMMLLRDSISPKALLTGTSIAGALRNYLHEYENNYAKSESRQNMSAKLFGDLFAYKNEKHFTENQKLKTKQEDTQSVLIIDDAISSSIPSVELRDGVKINGVTGTAFDKAKYDLELLSAETHFPLNFELLIERDKDEDLLKQAFALTLEGLKNGEISIGMKKRRGFGRCHVEKWQVWEFDLREYEQRIKWLNFPHWTTNFLTDYPTNESITDALNVFLHGQDKRHHITIQATFTLASPLLIRSGQASSDKAPDVVHLKSRRNGELKSILSGTSLAGVLRHRAERIVNTLQENTSKTESIIDEIFGVDIGKDKTKEAKASRLIVDEAEIDNTTDLIQNRIAIDRFTGGALHGALFQEQPIFGNNETSLVIKLELRQSKDHEIGLLLLLLKDLWTGDLPVGGTSSIGRGRLQGKEAIIKYEKKTWRISQKSIHEPFDIDNPEDLEKFVTELNKEVSPLESTKM